MLRTLPSATAGLLFVSAGLAQTATAQPVTDLPVSALLDASVVASDPDGAVPVRSWTLEGLDATRLPTGWRSCASSAGVGTDPEIDSVGGAAFGPDGSWFVVSGRDSRNLVRYAAADRAVLGTAALSGSPVDVAVSSDGAWAVTANLFEDTASIVDLSTDTEVAVVPVGDAPIMVRITPDGSTALVGSMVGDDVAVIDIATGTEVRRIGGLNFGVVLSANFESWAVQFSCSNPLAIADNSTAIFPGTFDDEVSFIDIGTGAVTSVASSDAPRQVAVNGDGTVAVVTHAFGSSDDLDVIDVATQTVTQSIDVGTTCYGPVSLNPAGTVAAVAVQNAVRFVDLGSGTVGSNLNTASVNQLLTTGDGQYVLCVGFRGSLLDYSSQSFVKNLNEFVSTAVGAVSPTEPRGVMFATTFGEQMVVVDTDGAAGFREEVRPGGPAPEGDKPRTIAVTPDGSTVVTTNQFSQNASVFDASTMTMLGYADLGLRPGQVKITPDGTRAVVTNRDADFVSVIDLVTLAVDEVTISTRGDQLAISPDGTYAYVAVVVSDGVWRVNLDTLSVEGPRLATGQMGGAGYTGNQFSGMSLSHDGGTLVACNSFDDNITIIDTASWGVVATVGVGDFPTTASFSPDDSRIYVTNRSSETVSVVSNAGAGSALVGTASVGAYPFTSVSNADGSVLYVMNTQDDAVGVVDTVGLVQTATVPVTDTPVGIAFDAGADRVLVAIGTASASTNGDLTQAGGLDIIDAATNTVRESVCSEFFLSDLAVDAGAGLAAAAGMGGEAAVFFEIGSCRPDVNGDGTVNTQDVLLFLNLWNAGDPVADWNGDGTVNTVDFLAFLNDWVAGC